MSDTTDLLIEIGMEELPPKAMLPLAEALATAVHTGLKGGTPGTGRGGFICRTAPPGGAGRIARVSATG